MIRKRFWRKPAALWQRLGESQLSPQGFEELSRAHLIDPTTDQLRQRQGVTWAHPAYAYRHVFARNDEELVCADLSSETASSAAARSK